jgi:hypothetical protein
VRHPRPVAERERIVDARLSTNIQTQKDNDLFRQHNNYTMMMEWELINGIPTHNEMTSTSSSAPDSTASFSNEKKKQSSCCGTAREEKCQWNTASLDGLLNKADVLMGEPCSISKYVKGTSFYRQQIHQYRQLFRDMGDPIQQNYVIQRIVDSVWEKYGRFLVFDEKSGCLSHVPNDNVLVQARRDLWRNPKTRKTSQARQATKKKTKTKRVAKAKIEIKKNKLRKKKSSKQTKAAGRNMKQKPAAK